MLWNEQVVNVKSGGEISVLHREAWKILRSEGQSYGTVRVFFDSDTRVVSMKGWSIPPGGVPAEFSEKYAVDASVASGNLYDDSRQKVLRLPASRRGTIVAVEYEQKSRPSIQQHVWLFQREIPVRHARFSLRLPVGWRHREFWANHSVIAVASDTSPDWELNDLSAIPSEPLMPHWRTTAGQLLVAWAARDLPGGFEAWQEVGKWYSSLLNDRMEASPEIRQQVASLTSGLSDVQARIFALAAFVQQKIRYVAIEVGVGGYQPHLAAEIFRNQFGDCKDKVTLLRTMLHEIGVESHHVLVNADRGAVVPEFPTPLLFNHVILAIDISQQNVDPGLPAAFRHADGRRLLLFDPTDPYTLAGYLPSGLQASRGLLVSKDGGELLPLPLLPSSANTIVRNARIDLNANGDVTGQVSSLYRGDPAFGVRGLWDNSSSKDRLAVAQGYFDDRTIPPDVTNLKSAVFPDGTHELSLQVRLPRQGSPAGDLLLINPRVFHKWGWDLKDKPRTLPLEFDSTFISSDSVEITIPENFVVDDLPESLNLDIGVASYSSSTVAEGRLLRHTRRFEVRDVTVGKEKIADVRNFLRQMSTAEKATVVLRKR